MCSLGTQSSSLWFGHTLTWKSCHLSVSHGAAHWDPLSSTFISSEEQGVPISIGLLCRVNEIIYLKGLHLVNNSYCYLYSSPRHYRPRYSAPSVCFQLDLSLWRTVGFSTFYLWVKQCYHKFSYLVMLPWLTRELLSLFEVPQFPHHALDCEDFTGHDFIKPTLALEDEKTAQGSTR